MSTRCKITGNLWSGLSNLAGLAATVLALLWIVGTPRTAYAQVCQPLYSYDLVIPPALEHDFEYGYSMVSSGDWLFVGAPMTYQMVKPGAVYVFKRIGSNWVFLQRLLPAGSGGAIYFGFSVAAENNVLVVGAIADVDTQNGQSNGAAYVFSFNGQQWVQQQKLQAFGPGNYFDFAYAVAIHGDLIAVGVHGIFDGTIDGHGAALIYRYDGTRWNGIAKLTADAPALNDAFGTALSMNDQHILVGCPYYSAAASQAGAVFVFGLQDNDWTLLQKLEGGAMAQAHFGTSLSVDGNRCVVGAPQSNLLASSAGAAFAYSFNGKEWAPAGPPLLASDGASGDEFGTAVSIYEDAICVGAPNCTVYSLNGDPGPWQRGGAAYIFRHVNGNWSQERRINLLQPVNSQGYAPYSYWLVAGPQPANWPQSLDFAKFGSAVAVTNDCVLASTPRLVRSQLWNYTGPDGTGSVNAFPLPALTDCNGNGIDDACDPEPDCNGNGVPDSCDLIARDSADCNINSVPDECEEGARYQLDDGGPFDHWGLTSNHFGDADVILVNRFRVKPGGQFISHISLATSQYLPLGTPVTVMLYKDPIQRGDPYYAVLLESATTTAFSYDTGVPEQYRFVHVPIKLTYVGEPGTIFFAGVLFSRRWPLGEWPIWFGPNWYPVRYSPQASPQRTWIATTPPGMADIRYLNQYDSVHFHLGNLALRAIAADCNGNGVWDACDIANGTLADINHNGIPDSCEANACRLADVSPNGGDGVIDVSDLLTVINHWGGCTSCYAICPGDVNDDCLVNVTDLLAVVSAWGPCP